MSATTLDAAGSTSRAARWINNLLVVGIGIALAWLTIKWLPQDERTALPPIVPQAGAASQQQSSAALAQGIANQHVFGDATAAPPPQAEAPPPQKIEDTRLNLSLAGVFAYQPAERAIAIISAGQGEQNAYGIGDKVSGETTLEEVHPDHVVLNNRGKLEKLSLPENVQPIAMAPVQSISAAPSGNAGGSEASGVDPNLPVELPTNPGELRDTLARNPSLLARVVAAEPYQENGKLLGYRIMPKQNPEILEAQGIIAGDVITRVNNIDLNSQKQGIRALRNAVKAQSLDVTILRDGVEIPVSISLAQ